MLTKTQDKTGSYQNREIKWPSSGDIPRSHTVTQKSVGSLKIGTAWEPHGSMTTHLNALKPIMKRSVPKRV